MVGGGHNGLVAAAYLARNGLDTVVCERRDVTGGAAKPVTMSRDRAVSSTAQQDQGSVAF